MMQRFPLTCKRTAADELPAKCPPQDAAAPTGSGARVVFIQQDTDDFPIDGSEDFVDGPYANGDYLVFKGDPSQNGVANLEFVDTGMDFFTVWNEYPGSSVITNSLTSGGQVRNSFTSDPMTEIPGNSAWQFLRIGEAISGAFPGWNANDYVGFQINGDGVDGIGSAGQIMQMHETTILSATLKAGNGLGFTGVEVVPAKGATSVIIVHKVTFQSLFGTTNYTGTPQLNMVYDGAVPADWADYPAVLRDTDVVPDIASLMEDEDKMDRGNINDIYGFSTGNDLGPPTWKAVTELVNKPIKLIFQNGTFSGGDGDLRVRVWYTLHDTA